MDNTNPLVSIIIPCYNYGRYVAQTLDSVLAQSYQNWECLVIDDGSKDNSGEVVTAYEQKDQRIKYIYQENTGLPGARNKGLSLSKGDLIQFLDADDLLENEKLSKQVEQFLKDTELDFVYSGLMYFMDGQPSKLFYSMDWINRPWTLSKSGYGKDLLKYFIISSAIMPPMPLIKKTAIEKVGYFTDELKSCEDWEFWLRCANENLKFHYLDLKDTRSLMRVHGSSMTKNRTVMLESMIAVREIISEMVSGTNLVNLNQDFIINDWIEFAIVKQQNISTAEALSYLKEKKNTTSALRLSIFPTLLRLLPPRFSLTILRLIRSIMKKKYYSSTIVAD